MTLYRITLYPGKDVTELDDEDDLRDYVDNCLDDVEKKSIKSFTVSWISEKGGPLQKPFWEE